MKSFYKKNPDFNSFFENFSKNFKGESRGIGYLKPAKNFTQKEKDKINKEFYNFTYEELKK